MSRASARPKAGVSVLGVRVEAHVLWMAKWYYLRLIERLERLLGALAYVTVRALTHEYSPETRLRWKQKGHLARLDPLLSRGHMKIPFGLAAGMHLAIEHVDVAGAQTHGMIRGLHEPMVQEALRRTLQAGGVFYDVGANIGITGLVAARLVGRTGHVVSIEPEPANVEAIHAHIRLNHLRGCIVIPAAATRRSEPVEVIGVQDTLWTRLARVGDHPLERERISVRGVSLDDLVASGEAPPPDVVKIDVEGAELDVLEGMRTVMARHRPVIVAEMHGQNRAVCEFLTEVGYRVSNLDGPDSPSEAHDQVHVLAEPL